MKNKTIFPIELRICCLSVLPVYQRCHKGVIFKLNCESIQDIWKIIAVQYCWYLGWKGNGKNLKWDKRRDSKSWVTIWKALWGRIQGKPKTGQTAERQSRITYWSRDSRLETAQGPMTGRNTGTVIYELLETQNQTPGRSSLRGTSTILCDLPPGGEISTVNIRKWYLPVSGRERRKWNILK